MKTKKYTLKDFPPSTAEEPIATYGYPSQIGNDTVVSSLSFESQDEIPEELKARFARWKAEADKIYGKKKRMTVDEYFGKLRYIVNAYYDDIQD